MRLNVTPPFGTLSGPRFICGPEFKGWPCSYLFLHPYQRLPYRRADPDWVSIIGDALFTRHRAALYGGCHAHD